MKTIEYKIVPKGSFLVLRNCSGCGQKSYYKNTGRFRVNANGSRLDIWLIYQCEKCKHTFNLTIYERHKASAVPEEEYQRFLNNDMELAEEYGKNFLFFRKNKAEVDSGSVDWQIVRTEETDGKLKEDRVIAHSPEHCTRFLIRNPYGLKVRAERQIAEVLGISGSQVKKRILQEQILIGQENGELLEAMIFM